MNHFILIFTFLFSINLLSAESDQRYQQGNTSGQQDEDPNDILKIPGIKKLVKLCEKNNSDNISDCLWDEVKKPENESIKELVQNHLEIKKGAKNFEKFDSLSIYKKDREKNLVLKNMEDFFSQKLKKSLHGIETEDGKESSSNKTVSHDVYYKIAKAHLSKSIILAISSYCIEADIDNDFRLVNDKAYRTKIKKINLQNLSKIKAPSKAGDETTIQAYSDWGICYSIIPQICYQPKNLADKYLTSLKGTPKPTIYSINDEEADPDDPSKKYKWKPKTKNSYTLKRDEENELSHQEYSRMRACEVVNYMEKAKLEISSLTGIEERFSKLNKVQGTKFNLKVKDKSGKESNLNIYNQKEEDNGIDDILITTSKDFSKAHEEGVQEELKEFEKCGAVDDTTGKEVFTGADKKACERYLSQSKKEIDKSIAGDHIKSKVHEEHTIEATKDKEGLSQILEDQGYTEDKIKEMLDKSEDKIREQINHRYKMKNAAIIDSLKVKGQRVAKKGDKEVSFESSDSVENEDVDKLLAIQKKLKKSTENFTQLVHFNNIVSGYLGIKNEDSKKLSKNINSIKKEAEGLAEDIDLGGGKDADAYKTVLDQSLKETDILKAENISDEEGAGAELDVKRINQILKYDTDE